MLFSYMTADITTYEIYITYLRNESPTDSDVTSLLHEGLTTADVTINKHYIHVFAARRSIEWWCHNKHYLHVFASRRTNECWCHNKCKLHVYFTGLLIRHNTYVDVNNRTFRTRNVQKYIMFRSVMGYTINCGLNKEIWIIRWTMD